MRTTAPVVPTCPRWRPFEIESMAKQAFVDLQGGSCFLNMYEYQQTSINSLLLFLCCYHLACLPSSTLPSLLPLPLPLTLPLPLP